MSKLQRYGERRDTPCRFLSPEPLSCRPFAVPLIADKSCIACRFLTVYGNSAGSVASGIPVTALRSREHKRGQRRERNSRNGTAFSRAQARSAPRAHVRGLLCGTQSSKEQLRRSRTESSGAPPAIEELAGEARQVRPAGPRAEKLATSFCLLTGEEVWRATGPPAPTTGKLAAAACISLPLPTAHHRSRKLPLRYRVLPSEEVWRATGPPAPSSIKFSRKFSISPTSRLRTAEAGKSRYGTAFAHPCILFSGINGEGN